MPKALAIAFFLVLLATLTASGQQNSSAPSRLALEVYHFPNEPPTYIVVPPSGSEPAGAWTPRFRRVSGWKDPEGSLPVYAVNVQTVHAGDGVKVLVSVMLGEKRLEQEKSVGIYDLREGERIIVREAAKFGVEPFEIALIRVAPMGADLPRVISKVKSIEVVAIEPVLSTLPSNRLALRNLSNKNISALRIRILEQGRTQISSLPQGEEGRPLIPAGGVSEFTEPVATKAVATPGGYKPESSSDQVIEISSAVFDDASFEGDIEPAITYRSFIKGRKLQLTNMIKLFDKALQNDSSDPVSVLELLRKDVAALKIETDATAVQEVVAEFPSLTGKSGPGIKTAIEVAMTGVRKDTLTLIQTAQLSDPAMQFVSFQAWLTAIKQRYEVWLSRL